LRALREDPSGMSLGQIADRVGLARSTVQRIVAALQEERLVITMGNGGIRLGPEVIALAESVKLNVVDFCRPYLTELAHSTGETADLSVMRGRQMIFLDQVSGTHRLRTVSAVGEVFPMTDTANGRAILSLLPKVEAERIAHAEWGALWSTEAWDRLVGRLDRIRENGLAYDLEEHTAGISAVGFAFLDWAGAPHAISVPVPSSRFDEVKDKVAEALAAVKPRLTDAFRTVS
jgi:DNA-binding IclR family transcriptional regulator